MDNRAYEIIERRLKYIKRFNEEWAKRIKEQDYSQATLDAIDRYLLATNRLFRTPKPVEVETVVEATEVEDAFVAAKVSAL